MKIGDLVRIKKTCLDEKSTTWFRRFAEEKTTMLVIGYIGVDSVEVMRPDGSSLFLFREYLTKRL